MNIENNTSDQIVTVEDAEAKRNAVQRNHETDLLNRVRSDQDQRAFNELFSRFTPKLKSYLGSLGAAHDVAEAIIQDVMITVWTKANLFHSEKASARTWIYTLVRNRLIDHRRANARRNRAYEQFADNLDEPETTDDSPLNHVAGQQMTSLLSKLPNEQAEILLLAYVEGKSHREIAEQLGIPIGTTKSRVRLAFQRLRKLMEEKP